MIKYIDFHTHNLTNVDNILEVQSISHPKEKVIHNYHSIGMHPWDLNAKSSKSDFEKLINLAHNQNCLAIGETGLDRKCGINFELQTKLFRSHIELATNLSKPIVIHSVSANNDIYKTLVDSKFKYPVIFHDFNANTAELNQAMKLNSYFSIGNKLFNENAKIYPLIESIPISRIFLETDESTRLIQEVYKKYALVTNSDIDSVKHKIYENFIDLYPKFDLN